MNPRPRLFQLETDLNACRRLVSSATGYMDRYVPAVAKPKAPTESIASGGGGGGGSGGALRGERALTVEEGGDPELDDGIDEDDDGGGGGGSEDDDDGTSWLDSQVSNVLNEVTEEYSRVMNSIVLANTAKQVRYAVLLGGVG